jgi:hypothetical protein
MNNNDYTMQALKEAIAILSQSPFWSRYSLLVKRTMARELAQILYTTK